MPFPNCQQLVTKDFKIVNKQVYILPDKTKNRTGILLVWGDFCGHCHRFMPTFNEITDKVKNSVTCLAIESEQFQNDQTLARALNLQGYPSLYFFNDKGLITEMYNGSRDQKSILDQICKNFHYCNF